MDLIFKSHVVLAVIYSNFVFICIFIYLFWNAIIQMVRDI